MNSGWTGIDELDSVLRELVTTASAVLADNLVGVYLNGSFALDAADAESDCDFVVVTATSMEGSRADALRAFHAELPHRPGYWNAHLEGSYAPADDLQDVRTIGHAWPYVGHGSDELVLDAHGNTAADRWVLHDHGVPLFGPEPATVVAPIPDDLLRTAALASLKRAALAWRTHSEWDAWSQRYAVVSLPRMVHSALTGTVISKSAAVTWAAQNLDPRWASLMHTALTTRGRLPWNAKVDPDLVAETLQFVDYIADASDDVSSHPKQ